MNHHVPTSDFQECDEYTPNKWTAGTQLFPITQLEIPKDPVTLSDDD